MVRFKSKLVLQVYHHDNLNHLNHHHDHDDHLDEYASEHFY